MASAGNRSPSAARRNQPCQLADLSDEDLAAIFQHLPPYVRLLVSEVCRRWYEISRKAWLDVKRLDLSPIPNGHIEVIVRQCPNLQSVYASHKSFGAKPLHVLPSASALSFVSLYDCTMAVCRPGQVNFMRPLFADRHRPALRDAPWQELVLDRVGFISDGTSAAIAVDRACRLNLLPSSLKRLQLSDLCGDPYLCGLELLLPLECLILHGGSEFHDLLPSDISALVNLKELCVGPVSDEFTKVDDLSLLASSLPRLQVLFVSDIGRKATLRLSDFITKSSLRILVLAGEFGAAEPIDMPARKRFPNGFGGPELPMLNVFVGKEASEKIRFERSNAATFSPITEPMPQFLEREEIAPIFQGVWIAAQIKETARNGGALWNHETHDRAINVQYQ